MRQRPQRPPHKRRLHLDRLRAFVGLTTWAVILLWLVAHGALPNLTQALR